MWISSLKNTRNILCVSGDALGSDNVIAKLRNAHTGQIKSLFLEMKTWNWEADAILCHIFSHVYECILTAMHCAVFVLLLMHVLLWLSLLSFLYIVISDDNKGDQSIIHGW